VCCNADTNTPSLEAAPDFSNAGHLRDVNASQVAYTRKAAGAILIDVSNMSKGKKMFLYPMGMLINLYLQPNTDFILLLYIIN
jgi:hypothetical protein